MSHIDTMNCITCPHLNTLSLAVRVLWTAHLLPCFLIVHFEYFPGSLIFMFASKW